MWLLSRGFTAPTYIHIRHVIINLMLNVNRAHSEFFLNNHALSLIIQFLVSKYFFFPFCRLFHPKTSYCHCLSVVIGIRQSHYPGNLLKMTQKTWLNLQFSLVVFETFLVLNAFYCAFSHFAFKCQKHNYFCCDFLLGLLILNLSFVANFEVVYF